MTAGDSPYGGERGGVISQGRPLLGAAPQFVNRPYSKDIHIGGGGSFPNDPYGMVARRRDGNPAKDNHRGLSLRSALSP